MSWFNQFVKSWIGKNQSSPAVIIQADCYSKEQHDLKEQRAADLAHQASIERAQALDCAKAIKELWLSQCDQNSGVNALNLRLHKEPLVAIMKAPANRRSWTH
jgi:hypothetical protein